MPLSDPVSRELAHTRVVTCKGFKREDGLWDIEGRIVDTKPYRFENRDRGGWIEKDEPLHDISIRLTINMDMEVVDAEAVLDSSPYNYCKCIAPIAKNLIGLKIAAGWSLRSTQAMGRKKGCTHLTELLGPVGTTAMQTVISERIRIAKAGGDKGSPDFLNACHSYATDSPVVKRKWPEYYEGE